MRLEQRKLEAQRLTVEGRWEEAMCLWASMANKEGKARFFVYAAAAALEGGASEEAERLLRKALELDHNDIDALFDLGMLFEEQDRLIEARAILEQGLKLEERQPILNILGSVQRRLDDRVAAEASLKRSLELFADDDEAHYGLGLVLIEARPREAVVHFKRALEIDPHLRYARRELGYSLWKAGRFRDAEEMLRAAVMEVPDDPWAHDYLGHLLLLRDCLDDAEAAFREAIRFAPDVPLLFCNLGDALIGQDRLADAEAAYLKALSLDTNDYLANLRYGQLLKRQGRTGRARKYLTRCLRSKPDDTRALSALADLDERKHRPPGR